MNDREYKCYTCGEDFGKSSHGLSRHFDEFPGHMTAAQRSNRAKNATGRENVGKGISPDAEPVPMQFIEGACASDTYRYKCYVCKVSFKGPKLLNKHFSEYPDHRSPAQAAARKRDNDRKAKESAPVKVAEPQEKEVVVRKQYRVKHCPECGQYLEPFNIAGDMAPELSERS